MTTNSNNADRIVEQRNMDKLRREMGDIVRKAMDDPTVIEVIVNPNGEIVVDRIGRDMETIGVMELAKTIQLLGTIAHMLHTTISYDNPILEGELPGDGSRVEGVVSPITEGPSINIRKKASAVFSLDEYVASGRAVTSNVEVLRQAILDRKNILVVGGTGTGKTTFVNAILKEISVLTPKHRIISIEDTRELQFSSENVVSMRTTANENMQVLLRVVMRQRPDRIVVGEVRGGEALSMLKAWNTGHPGGICTVHANSARAGLLRIEQLISEVSASPMNALIAEAIDIVAYLVRDPKIGPKLAELVAVEGVDDKGRYIFRDTHGS